MFSWLLDRGDRQETIDELEAELAECREELERVESQLEAADERRREAVRARQEAQEERNRLRDRVEQLEADLERAGSDQQVQLRGEATLGPRAARRVVEALSGFETEPDGAYTAMIEADRPEAVVDHFGERVALVDRATPCLLLFDRDGLIEVALSPPVTPEPFATWQSTFDIEPDWFVPHTPHWFAIVRNDLAALGRFDGDDLAFHDGFESNVQGRHSKGGFSQARFERRRAEQVEDHLDRARDLLETVPTEVPLILTGSESALDVLSVESRARATVDASGGPEDALDAAFRSFWQTRLRRL